METNDIGENNITLHELQPSNERSETGILSDIMDVIGGEMFQHDPSIAEALNGGGAQPQAHAMDPTQQATAGFNGTAALLQQQQNQQQNQQQQQQQQQQQHQQHSRNIRRKVKIIEQPASKALRFRYECEGRSAGSIPGFHSTQEKKTFPTIEIVGYKGRAVVVVSCVTKDPPYRPHPHNLVGKEGCKKGVCTLEINSESMRAVFGNLGIQCVKKKDIEAALRAREEIRVDPFKTGFAHKFQPSSIDLNSVRLCFQVFLESDVRGRFTVPLTPVVSEPIYDKKAMSDLVICRLCSCSSTVYGGKEIILLCEKVAKEDISVRFYEEHNNQVIWEAFGDFQHTDVHKQTAIAFRTPRYRTMDIEQPAKVLIQLRRPSDGAVSEALPFDYLPLESDPAVLKRKRQRLGGDPSMHIMKHFQAQELQQQQHQQQLGQHQNDHTDGRNQQAMNFLNVLPNPAIKTEPRDTSPLPYGMYNNAYRIPDQTPSPQPVSPSTPYNHNASGTPSPYNMGAAGNGNLISPSHQYGMAGEGAGAGAGAGAGGGGATTNGSPMDYDAYHQQQHHAGSINTFNHMQSPPTQWPGDANIKQRIQNINQCQSISINLRNYNVNGILTRTAAPSAGGTSSQASNNQPYNLLSGAMANNYHINNLMTNTQHNQHHHHQPQPYHNNLDGGSQGGAAATAAAAAASTNEAPSISSLLNMDSDKLLHFNSEELSNLSIS